MNHSCDVFPFQMMLNISYECTKTMIITVEYLNNNCGISKQ